MTRTGLFHCELAWLGDEAPARDVLVEVDDGMIVGVTPGMPAPAGATRLSGIALPGSVVKVYYDGDKDDTETFLIATRQEGVTDGKLEVYSPNSPLGGALLDHKVGDEVTYTVPNGNTMKVTLVSAEPYHS